MVAIRSIISLLGVVLCTCKLVTYNRHIYISLQTICAHYTKYYTHFTLNIFTLIYNMALQKQIDLRHLITAIYFQFFFFIEYEVIVMDPPFVLRG